MYHFLKKGPRPTEGWEWGSWPTTGSKPVTFTSEHHGLIHLANVGQTTNNVVFRPMGWVFESPKCWSTYPCASSHNLSWPSQNDARSFLYAKGFIVKGAISSSLLRKGDWKWPGWERMKHDWETIKKAGRLSNRGWEATRRNWKLIWWMRNHV